MGLGKTIQTIALLAHLACEKGDWGPHLIVVPTSVMLNWEMEFKKWCPAFKILTYYGNPKERRLKRTVSNPISSNSETRVACCPVYRLRVLNIVSNIIGSSSTLLLTVSRFIIHEQHSSNYSSISSH